jgi:hypothetical protein
MTVRRAVVGKRANGEMGVFVSPAGIDALTASDEQLILNISSKVAQLLMLGYVGGSTTVALGLTRVPIVFLTSYSSMDGIFGYESYVGPLRPSPSAMGSYTHAASSATINGGGASMTLSGPTKMTYAVYNQVLG